MSKLLSSSRGPAAAGRRMSVRESVSLLRGLKEFCRLLDARELPQPLESTPQAAVLLSLRYFALPQALDRAVSFEPVCGGTWGQGYEAILDLAARATGWAEAREIDPLDESLVRIWSESIGLAWATELTARCHLVPAPYMAWEAAMLLAAAGLAEQLRLLDCDGGSGEARLGPGTVRQLEGLVIEHDLPPSLSLAGAPRKASFLGPWPTVALAYRLSQWQCDFEWADGVISSIEVLPTTRVVEQCVAVQLKHQWSEYMELARRAWLAGLAVSRRAHD